MGKGFELLASREIGNLDVLASLNGDEFCPITSCGSLDISLCVRGIVDAFVRGEEAVSNLLRKDETFPVTTGEGERFRSVILVPVPDLPLKSIPVSLDSLFGVME